jgi:putative membrane protein
MWWDTYWPMPWMLFGPVTMIVIFVLCFAFMAFMMSGMMRRPHHGKALEILRERYARGEINQAEFEERSRLLER